MLTEISSRTCTVLRMIRYPEASRCPDSPTARRAVATHGRYRTLAHKPTESGFAPTSEIAPFPRSALYTDSAPAATSKTTILLDSSVPTSAHHLLEHLSMRIPRSSRSFFERCARPGKSG